MNRLEEIRQRLEAATAGPWQRAKPEGWSTDEGWGHDPRNDVDAGDKPVISSVGYDADSVLAEDSDINLIAHAPEDIALLLEVVEAAAVLKVDVDTNEGGRWPHLWKRLEAALDKLTVEIPE